MGFTHAVVDGSNIATEGRSVPSLVQLDEAVREFQREFPGVEITVVVDATFGHRIDDSERPAFDEAQSHGELISPPAGAIGRGDAFLLRIADRSGATVLSNDSFQEFHGEYDWLFEKDRLIGGKPVPGVGWIFTPRTPVRGPKSRESVREAKRSRARVGSKEASQPMPVPTSPPPRAKGRARKRKGSVQEAIAAATEEVLEPEAPRRRRRRGGGPPAEAVNDPLTFITFIASHSLGAEVAGDVESFSSHGAFVVVEGARCYIPLSAMGDPPPRAARQVMSKGERRTFVVQALDPQRRGIELALPGFAHVSGAPQEETVEAEIESTEKRAKAPAKKRAGAGKAPARKAAARKASASGRAARAAADTAAAPAEPVEAPAGTSAAGKAPPKTGAAGKSAAKKAAARTGAKKATAKTGAAKKTAGKAAPKPVAAKAGSKGAPAKATTAKGVAAKAGVAKTGTGTDAAARKAVTAKKGAPARKATVAKKATVKQAASKQPAAKQATARKATAKKATAKKATARKATAEQPASKQRATTKAASPKKQPTKRAAPAKTPSAKTGRAKKGAAAADAVDNRAPAATRRSTRK